jgi:flagellar operon protein
VNGIDPALLRPITTGRGLDIPQKAAPLPGKSFEQILNERLGNNLQHRQITFSKHALSRTEQRGIELGAAELQKLDTALARAGEKGLSDALVYMNDTAFLVNVPQKVVVAVVEKAREDAQVFTNIDGAVLI